MGRRSHHYHHHHHHHHHHGMETGEGDEGSLKDGVVGRKRKTEGGKEDGAEQGRKRSGLRWKLVKWIHKLGPGNSTAVAGGK